MVEFDTVPFALLLPLVLVFVVVLVVFEAAGVGVGVGGLAVVAFDKEFAGVVVFKNLLMSLT